MCVHDVEGQRGWNSECVDSSHCMCGYFREIGPAFPRPRTSVPSVGGVKQQSIARTVFHILAGVVLVLAALVVGVLWLIQPEDEYRRYLDDRRRYG